MNSDLKRLQRLGFDLDTIAESIKVGSYVDDAGNPLTFKAVQDVMKVLNTASGEGVQIVIDMGHVEPEKARK